MSDSTITPAAGLTRREMVATLAAMSAGAALRPTTAQASEAARRTTLALAGGSYAPKIYTAHEWNTVQVLVDLIIPRDAKSGSATEAAVPEFMDQILFLEPGMRTAHRGGLAWLDHECRARFGNRFVESTEAQRRAMLDDIAWPDRAPAEYFPGVQWFNSFRDLTATGFFTSEMGVNDIGYMGNTAVMEWKGCPAENLGRLGV